MSRPDESAMSMTKTFFITIIFSVLQETVQIAKFEIETKSIKCWVNEDLVWDYGCRVRAVRRKLGLISLYINVSKPLVSVFSKYTLYYMYGTIYRSYMLDLDRVDNCDGYQSQMKRSKNVFNTIMIDFIKKFYPGLTNNCPFKGYVGGVDWDLNATLSQVLPPIAPRGQYKFFCRYYTGDNETIIQYEVVAVLRPNRANLLTDFSIG